MSTARAWVTDDSLGLLTDLYELTMLQAYWREGMDEEAVFSLFVRRLPQQRNFLLAAGLDDALHYLEKVRFGSEALAFLRQRDEFSDAFVDWLGDFRFTGDVYAVPEGTPVFADEPLLEVVGPIAEAQLAESFIMNQVHHQTVIASKAARVVAAAEGRAVVDFGMRRMHGADAAMKAARAFHIAGLAATSNVLAGKVYGIPISGTMAHSYIQAHDSELEAFRGFAELYPDTVLLVDTYDTLGGVRRVVELARQLGDRFQVRAVRLDSGDLAELAIRSRELLDEAGLSEVRIFASGGLDEHEIASLLERGAPIDGFGVGTGMGVSTDAPALDIAYKLTSYGGEGRLKLSSGKPILPGRKQVLRREEGGEARSDLIVRHDEEAEGRPLLAKVMEGGRRTDAGRVGLEEARRRAAEEIGRLPARIRSIDPAEEPYLVAVSDRLRRQQQQVAERVAGAAEGG